MRIGYARTSTADQPLDMQVDALTLAGCEKIFTDVASGAKTERPGLNEIFQYLREGDILVVYKLDRLGRSLSHLIEMMNKLEAMKASFFSLSENIDTTTVMGKFIFHFVSSLAEFELNLTRERVNAGIKAARARGRVGGRPSMPLDKIKRIQAIYNAGGTRITEICKLFKISEPTVYKYARMNIEGKTL